MLDRFIRLVHDTGPLTPLIILLTCGACMVAAVLALVGGLGRRVPAPLWLVAPLAVVWMGGLATIYGCRMVIGASNHIDPTMRTTLAYAGLSEALGGFNLGFGGAGSALLLSAGLASLASLARVGPATRWRPGRSQIGGAIGILGALGIFAVTLADGDPRAAIGPCLVLMLVSFATLISGLRQSEASLNSPRQVSFTLSVGLLGVCAVAAFAARSGVSGWSDYFRGLAHVAPELRSAIAVDGLMRAADAAWFGCIAVGIAVIMGIISASKHGARLLQRGALIELVASGALVLGAVSTVGLYLWASAPLNDWTQLERYRTLGEIGKGLPSAALPDGRFGWGGDWDGPITLWTGLGWTSPDGTPLALPLSAGSSPVLAMAPDAPISSLLEPDWLEATSGDGAVRLILLATTPATVGMSSLIEDAAAALRIEGVEILAPARGGAGEKWLADWARDTKSPLLVADPSLAPDDFGGLTLRPGAEAATTLSHAVMTRKSQSVAFIPGAQWTAQDLITLCLAARAAARPSDEGEPPFDCVLSRDVPVTTEDRVDGATSALLVSLLVKLGDPIVVGPIDTSAIIEAVRSDLSPIAACMFYGRDPGSHGEVTVKFVIAKTGEVSKAELKQTSLNDAAVEDCVVARFARLRFPEPRGGGIVIVSFPVMF